MRPSAATVEDAQVVAIGATAEAAHDAAAERRLGQSIQKFAAAEGELGRARQLQPVK
jgi:hypothetical protein